MVLKEERERINKLISEALPILCKSGLKFSTEVSIDALIGITLDSEEVILVSVKQKVANTPLLDPSMYTFAEEGEKVGHPVVKKSPPKRKHGSDYVTDPGNIFFKM